MIQKNSVFYRTFTLTLSNIALQIIGFVYRIFLSRTTGAEGMGVYQLVMPYYSVVLAFCVTGLAMAASRLCAKYHALGAPHAARQVVLRAIPLFFGLFFAVAASVALYSEPLAVHILGDARTRLSLLIILPCLFCTGIENILKNYFFGIGQFAPPITSELTEQSVRFVAVAALLLTFRPQDAGSASALIICGMVISEIGSVCILGRAYRACAPRAHTNAVPRPALREIIAIAAPVSFAALCNNLLASANAVLIPQRLIASGMDSGAALSTFGVLFGMTLPLLSLPAALLSALCTVIVPTLSEGAAQKRATHLRRHAGKVIHVTGLLAFPALGAFLPLGRGLCQLFFRQPGAGDFMLPLCLGMFFSYYHLSLTALLNALGMQRRAARITILCGMVQLIGTWMVGLPGVGIWGFLLGAIVSGVLGALLSLIPLVRRLHLRMRWRNWLVTPLLAAALAGSCARLVDLYARNGGMPAGLSLSLALAAAVVIDLCALRAQGTSLLSYLKRLTAPAR